MAVPPSLQPPSAYFSAAERSQRSVFVGNIPYEATEDELKTIFSQAGPVVNFRLVFDRETGKPKGYGFCEYADQETAMSAMRNLNNVEFHGRTLRVDTATGDRNKEEIRQLQMTLGGPQEESPYGPPVEQDKAPEAISRAVASLPPEQMFELMKQMKLCIQNNPNEARNMLLQNPQLAYALLQAQVVMRIVDPQVALAMLHRDTMPIMVPPSVPPAVPVGMGSMGLPFPPIPGGPILPPPPVSVNPQSSAVSGIPVPASAGQPLPGAFPSVAPTRPPTGGGLPPLTSTGDVDYRQGIKLPPATSAAASASKPADAEESEKAQLIMQVLQLTDEQIALLPPDQRHSVLVLKEQLKGTSPAI